MCPGAGTQEPGVRSHESRVTSQESGVTNKRVRCSDLGAMVYKLPAFPPLAIHTPPVSHNTDRSTKLRYPALRTRETVSCYSGRAVLGDTGIRERTMSTVQEQVIGTGIST